MAYNLIIVNNLPRNNHWRSFPMANDFIKGGFCNFMIKFSYYLAREFRAKGLTRAFLDLTYLIPKDFLKIFSRFRYVYI